MNLTKYSIDEIRSGMDQWGVPQDYADPMYNYLVHGFEPGSFFTAILANDFMGAVQHSHPANTIAALKALVGWINDYMPHEANGSLEIVGRWCKKSTGERRAILETAHLIYTSEEEVIMTLKGVARVE